MVKCDSCKKRLPRMLALSIKKVIKCKHCGEVYNLSLSKKCDMEL
jgi:hypothetical protein